MTTTPGEEFARAIAAQDPDRLRRVLADHVHFQALTPGHNFEVSTAAEVVDEIILGLWFGQDTTIHELRSVSTGKVAGRDHVAYRLGLERVGNHFVVEQQAYYDAVEDQIAWIHILCAGYLLDLPREEEADDVAV